MGYSASPLALFGGAVLAGEGIVTKCLHANVPAPLDAIAVSGGADELVVDFRTQCTWPRLFGV